MRALPGTASHFCKVFLKLHGVADAPHQPPARRSHWDGALGAAPPSSRSPFLPHTHTHSLFLSRYLSLCPTLGLLPSCSYAGDLRTSHTRSRHRLPMSAFIEEDSPLCLTRAITRTMIGPCPRSAWLPRDTTPGPSNLNQKSIFEDFDNFWR